MMLAMAFIAYKVITALEQQASKRSYNWTRMQYPALQASTAGHMGMCVLSSQ